jgi:hypothetical protein
VVTTNRFLVRPTLRFDGAGSVTALGFDARFTPTDDQPEVDLREADFIEIYPLVGLACFLRENGERGTPARVRCPRRMSVRSYLSRMGFADVIEQWGCPSSDGLSPVRTSDRDDQLLELQTFSGVRGNELVGELLWQRLEPWVDPASLEALDIALGEIGDNVAYHARVDSGFVAAQSYNRGRVGERIDLAIGDTGIGIRRSLARFAPRSDGEALDLALRLLISSITDQGRGQGLATAAEHTTALRGTMILRSGAARRVLTHLADPREDVIERLQGTVVGVSIPCR